MINLSLRISNPFRNDRWSTLLEKYKRIGKNKDTEFKVFKSNVIISFMFSVNVQCDHPGFDFNIGLFGYEIDFAYYDIRVWDYENKCWKVYDENNI